MTAPKSRHEAPATAARGGSRAAPDRRLDLAASFASSVIRIDCAVSCSACASRSAAIHSALASRSARMSTSEGPAIMFDADLAEHQALGRRT